MQYGELITRSFRIAWNRKYLWLIALFSGEGGIGFNSSFNQNPSREAPTTPSPAELQHQITTWISEHAGLIAFLIVLWLVVVVAFFILAAICEGATVRAAAEHDADRPFGLGWAWRSGLATMWVIVRFRLLLVALSLPVLLIVAGFVFAVAASIYTNNGGVAIALVLLTLLLVLAAIPYFIYLFFLDRFGTRAVVLEQIGARAAIVRAHRLLFKRLGRAILVLLLAIGIAIGLGIVLACALAVVAAPLAIIGAVLFAAGSAPVWPLVVVGVLILAPIALIIEGFLAAQSSTYWTLAFRRIDLDPPQPYYQPMQPEPQPPPQVTS